jgi:hypothetical protein
MMTPEQRSDRRAMYKAAAIAGIRANPKEEDNPNDVACLAAEQADAALAEDDAHERASNVPDLSGNAGSRE